jgi:hypothetical protein
MKDFVLLEHVEDTKQVSQPVNPVTGADQDLILNLGVLTIRTTRGHIAQCSHVPQELHSRFLSVHAIRALKLSQLVAIIKELYLHVKEILTSRS